MPKHRPSPALVVACLALAIALGGTAYAASLPKNSVGSAQVKPNSLKGADIKEATLQGVVLGSGRAFTATKTMANSAPDSTLLTIPKAGQLRVACGSGATSGFVVTNTTASPARMWVDHNGDVIAYVINPTGGAGSSLDPVAVTEIVFRSAKRAIVIHLVSNATTGNGCTFTAIAQTVNRG